MLPACIVCFSQNAADTSNFTLSVLCLALRKRTAEIQGIDGPRFRFWAGPELASNRLSQLGTLTDDLTVARKERVCVEVTGE